jgi:uncharacterized SAM-binding protein YcdF (DUF218 family)
VKIIKFVFENLFSPIGLVSVLFVIGLVLSIPRNCRKLANRLLTVGAGLYVAFLCTPLVDLPFYQLERQFPPLLDIDSGGDARSIVVLSAYGLNSSETPITSNLSEETVYRLAEGIRLYRLVPRSTLIVSGGVLREGDPPIAQLMAEFLVSMGVPQNDIGVEGSSENTYENLRNVKSLVGDRAFYLVTSAYHMPRTMAVARQLGMHAIPSPAFIRKLQGSPPETTVGRSIMLILKEYGIPSGSRLTDLQRTFHEYVGYLWYRIRGWA